MMFERDFIGDFVRESRIDRFITIHMSILFSFFTFEPSSIIAAKDRFNAVYDTIYEIFIKKRKVKG